MNTSWPARRWESKKLSMERFLEIYLEIGSSAYDHGDEALANSMFGAAIDGAERTNKQGFQVGLLLEEIAAVHASQHNFKKAETFFKRALYTYQNSLSKYNHFVSTALDNLACLSEQQGNLGYAEQYLKRAHRADERSQVKDPVRISIRLKKLAFIYGQRGKVAEARLALQQAARLSR